LHAASVVDRRAHAVCTIQEEAFRTALRAMTICDETESRADLSADRAVAMHVTVAARALDLICRRYDLRGAALRPDIDAGLAMLARTLRRLRDDVA
jgi:hypothetical protein